mmetsp:Transcript_6922/g.8291  ORF Transcript_6922/g.8291 Transcript_6922/m.8291 type:complete len:115 (+) Transcript_6922:25-369(+)
MGCGDSKGMPEAPEGKGIMKQPVEEKLHLYGDWFNSDTRSIHAMLKQAGVDFDFTLVDTLKGENLQEKYQHVCPTGHIPVLSKDGQIVHSQGNLLYEWVLKKEPATGAAFFHEG